MNVGGVSMDHGKKGARALGGWVARKERPSGDRFAMADRWSLVCVSPPGFPGVLARVRYIVGTVGGVGRSFNPRRTMRRHQAISAVLRTTKTRNTIRPPTRAASACRS